MPRRGRGLLSCEFPVAREEEKRLMDIEEY
jgi:hypothetical protein